MPVVIFLAASLGLSSLWARPRTKKPPVKMMLGRDLVPQSRVGVGAVDKELSSRHKYFERYQTLYTSLEYRIADIWSVYGLLPYSKRWQTDSNTTRRLDNIHLGTRLGFRQGTRKWWSTGLDLELATGDAKKANIGSKELGSIEPWLGFSYTRSWVFTTALRYNAQTNKQFREKENQQFERTFYFDAALGYRLSSVDLMLEYNYQFRNDPEASALSTHTIAPALHFRLGDDDAMLLSVAVPWVLSREREWDHQARLEFSYYY